MKSDKFKVVVFFVFYNLFVMKVAFNELNVIFSQNNEISISRLKIKSISKTHQFIRD